MLFRSSTGWYTYSGDYQSHRFSRLSMINTRNVRRLRVAWQYQSNSNETIFETSPLAVGGVLYFTEPPANVVALDAVDGGASVSGSHRPDIPAAGTVAAPPGKRRV